MNCRRAQKLFSPWLDGELTEKEERALSEHLAACPACAARAAGLQEITAALRQGRFRAVPPEGFAAGVMARIRLETEAVRPGAGGRKAALAPGAGAFSGRAAAAAAAWRLALQAGWKKGFAVAAAAFLLLAGSTGLAARYFWLPPAGVSVVAGNEGAASFGGGLPEGTGQSGTDRSQTPEGGQGGSGQENLAPGTAGSGGGSTPPEAAGIPAAPERGVAGKETGSVSAGGSREQAQPPQETPAAPAPVRSQEQPPGSLSGPKVFLNQPRVIESMLVKVRVASLSGAADRLVAGARALGVSADYRDRVPVAGDNPVEIFRFSVPKSQAGQFTDFVSALGQVTEKSRETRDVSSQFAEQLSRYQSLFEERKTASGDQVKAIDAEIKRLEAELEAMDKEAREQFVLIVWLAQ